MAVGLIEPEDWHPVAGIKLAACSAGLYKRDRDDLVLISLAGESICSAVFTKNLFSAAPVHVARQHLHNASPGYIVINAGNANAGTGKQGIEHAIRVCRSVAETAGCQVSSVLPFSTGVIGEQLPVDRIVKKIPELYSSLSADNWLPAARAIMTTDTIAKLATRQVLIDGHEVTVTGIAKGAGMIRPDMATMLAFITTDVITDQGMLDRTLHHAVEKSFNRISIDGDTSTNDACVLVATGQSGCVIDQSHPGYGEFDKAVTDVCVQLAQAIVRDGEGATKFITIQIDGGCNSQECLQTAYSIANSPLVKTAFFASDPNWGRILAAIGRAGIQDLDITGVSVFLDNLCIVERGMRSVEYTEQAGQTIMQKDEILVRVKLNRGEASETVWTCDFSYDYVKINAEYRT